MKAPDKNRYNRRPRTETPRRRHTNTSTDNPYLFIPKQPPQEPKPKNPFRSVAARKPVPPSSDTIANQWHHLKDPVGFAQHVLGVLPWRKQQDILNALFAHPAVAVRSCNGAGKTFTAAIAVLWWLISHDDAIVITTAPSERQVREILWREVRRLYMPLRDVLGGKLTRTRLDYSPTRYAYGFSTNTEDRFQGFHSGNILVIVDEASGVDEFIFNAIQGVTTAKNSKLLLIGNPHGLAGTFYDAFHKNRTLYHTIHISAFDLPAFKAAGVTERNIDKIEFPQPDEESPDLDDQPPPFPYHHSAHGLSTPEWALKLFKSHGPNSSLYQTRVLGQFPDHADDTLIALKFVEAAVRRQTQRQPEQKPVMGVDVARYGNDKSVIIIRQGSRVLYIEEIRRSDTVHTTGRVVDAAINHKVRNLIIDEVGIGAGVVDTLRHDRRFNVRGLNGGNRADDPERYLNQRAQIFDGLRQRFEDGDITIPNDPELISQLASLTYRYNARGQLQLESKEQIRSTGRQSPDKADAIALAFAETIETRRTPTLTITGPNTHKTLRRARLWNHRLRE